MPTPSGRTAASCATWSERVRSTPGIGALAVVDGDLAACHSQPDPLFPLSEEPHVHVTVVQHHPGDNALSQLVQPGGCTLPVAALMSALTGLRRCRDREFPMGAGHRGRNQVAPESRPERSVQGIGKVGGHGRASDRGQHSASQSPDASSALYLMSLSIRSREGLPQHADVPPVTTSHR